LIGRNGQKFVGELLASLVPIRLTSRFWELLRTWQYPLKWFSLQKLNLELVGFRLMQLVWLVTVEATSPFADWELQPVHIDFCAKSK